jgi:predicted helicase
MRYQLTNLYENKNFVIAFSGTSSSKPFSTLITDTPYCYDLLEKTQCLPLYRYDKNGNRIENITDWGLQQFVKHYNKGINPLVITKQDIFHYVYAVLHHPAYRKKYELNLKREFPRIPFYDNFHQWAAWGEQLMNLHIHYETAEPYPLRITNYELRDGVIPKPKLKANKEAGVIILDEQTELHDIPAEAWNYKLGNRSALEWILDQYQEKKSNDPTIAEQFDTYRFADYKDEVIVLLQRVCTVSVETMKIVEEMNRNS